MKHILLTGSTGFIGRNILPILLNKYEISAPTRDELNLLDTENVEKYLCKNQFDVVLHLANPTGHNQLDTQDKIFENSLRVFTALAHCSSYYGKMIYTGSGAEYGKHRPLTQIGEEEFGNELPKDAYGLSRYIMNELARGHSNIINLRLFGCYGPGDPPHKLVPSVIAQARTGKAVILNQDCWFDFLYVTDIADVITFIIERKNQYSDYNICTGVKLRITEIAEEVCRQMGANTIVKCNKNGFNLEYTGSNTRIKNEIPDWQPLDLKNSISNILAMEATI